MDDGLLERPVWSALMTVHRRHAVGNGQARRFDGDVSPFGAAQDETEESLADLGSLIASTGRVVIGQAQEIVCPPGARIVTTLLSHQMEHAALDLPSPTDLPIRRLGEADASDMLDLATLTNPGPFALKTHELGEFWGIEADGRLVAMAGERLKQPGFTEISGICTHPDVRGRGYARALTIVVLNRIKARGERPYLHVFDDNIGAMNLYKTLGFRKQREIHVGVLEAA